MPPTKSRLTQILEDAGFDQRPYSGRNMYGATCTAFVDGVMQRQVITRLIRVCETVEEAAEIVHGMDVDHMGDGYVYYWPATADEPATT